MLDKRLVRARGDTGAPLRPLDPDVLCEALSSHLREEWEAGYLIFQLVVEGMDRVCPTIEGERRSIVSVPPAGA
jgi:hypothetical protein